MHNNILARIVLVRNVISLPSRDIHANELNLVLARIRTLLNSQVEVCDLAGKVLGSLATHKLARVAVDGDNQQLLAGINRLRNNDSAELATILDGDNAVERLLARRCNLTGRQVDSRLADSAGYQHLLLHRCELGSICPTIALREANTCRRHLVVELQRHTTLGRSDILGLRPQEVRSLIRRHLAVLGRGALILGNLVSISLDRGRLGIGIVAVEVDLCIVVLVEDIVLRHPRAILREGKLHVVGLVTLQHQLAGILAVIIHKEETHLIALAEAVRVDSRGLLMDITPNLHLRRSSLT